MPTYQLPLVAFAVRLLDVERRLDRKAQDLNPCLKVYLSGFSGETNQWDMCIYRKRSSKELAHALMEAGKSKICSVGQQARNQGGADAVQVQRPPAAWSAFLFDQTSNRWEVHPHDRRQSLSQAPQI